MANGRGGTWGPTPAGTSEGGGGYEYAMHVNKEPYGPTYDMVMSRKSGETPDAQDPHWTGQLLPPAHPRSDEAREFFSAMDVMER